MTEAVSSQRSALSSAQFCPCTCLLRGTFDGGLKQLVDQGLVRLSLPRCQPAQRREESGINSDRDELLRPARRRQADPAHGPRRDPGPTVKALLHPCDDCSMKCDQM